MSTNVVDAGSERTATPITCEFDCDRDGLDWLAVDLTRASRFACV